MSIDLSVAKQQLTTIRGLLDQLETTISTPRSRLHPGQSIQAALDQADDGAVVELEPGTYEGALVCRRPVVLRPTVAVAPDRASPASTPVTLISPADTVTIPGAGVLLSGLCVKSTNPDYQLVTVTGPRTTLDRLVLLGDPIAGQHRGIAANGAGTKILGCYVDQCWLPARDAQALGGWSGTQDLVVLNCFLSGGAETVMFGGADSASPDAMPRDILIEACDLRKDEAWYTKTAFLKTCLELKAARNVTVRNCRLRYAGISGGQGGYLIQLTPRNQGGKAPWSCVEHVLIENCQGARAAGAINAMGEDNVNPSGRLQDVTIRQTTFTDLDRLSPVLFPSASKGQGRVFQFQRGPQQITLDHVTAEGRNLNAALYLVGPPPVGLVLRDVTLPASKYGLKIDAGGQGVAAVKAYAPDIVLEHVTVGGVPV